LKVKNLSTALNQINKLVEEGTDLSIFIADFIDYIRQIMLYKIIGPSFVLDFDDNLASSIKKHAQDFLLEDISKLLNIILDKLAIKETIIDQLPLELACVEFLLTQTGNEENKVNTFSEGKDKKKIDLNIQDLENLQNNWQKIVERAKPFNHSLSAMLQTSHPLTMEENLLIIGLEYDFHKEQLDKIEVKENLIVIFSDILGRKVGLSFIIDSDYKQNHQSFKGKSERGVEQILDTFGGEML
jgi:DNA polymerase III gamma/tau subunit